MKTRSTQRVAPATYGDLAARWQPGHTGSRAFWIFAFLVVVLSLVGALYLSSLPVQKRNESSAAKVPERIARFIEQQDRPRPPPPPPPKERPRPVEPPHEAVLEQPRVVRERPRQPQKPLTEQQEKAREKASRSGLLAHMSELGDLMDTSAVDHQLQRGLRDADGDRDSAVHTSERLLADASSASAGVDAGKYATRAGDTELHAHATADADAALAAQAQADGVDKSSGSEAKSRSQEEISLVIDRAKSQLQALYNRARRSNPALRGRLILAITIAPDGGVTAVKVVSSELNDAALENRIIARVKTFQFGAKPVDTVTVHYPIEFLP